MNHTETEVIKVAYDVFTKLKGWRMKIVKLIWPDITRLSNALYDHWSKL